MPSRLKLAVPSATAAAVLGIASAGTLGATMGACIDGNGLDLGDPPGLDATTPLDGGEGLDGGGDACSPDLTSDPANCGACGKICPSPATVTDGGAGGGTQVAACVASACTVACAPGRADCNGSAADGCEVAVLEDPRSCGACGVSCGSQACDAGACPYGVLIEDGGTFGQIAVNASAIFAGATAPVAGVFTLSKDGGVESLLARGTPGAGLTLDGAGHVTFADTAGSSISVAPTAIPIEAGAAAVLYPGITAPRQLTYASGALVWTQGYANGDLTAPSQSGIFTSGPALVVPSTSIVRNLATTAGAVYFAGQNWLGTPNEAPIAATPEDIYACAFPSCAAATPIATAQYRVWDVATDGKNLFWTAWGNVDEESGTLVACPLAACAPAVLASGLGKPEAIVSDGVTVYWYESGPGSLRSLAVPAAGAKAGAPRTLASGLVGVTNLVLDATYIYWDQPSLGEIDRLRR
jgi:hypothetical protein